MRDNVKMSPYLLIPVALVALVTGAAEWTQPGRETLAFLRSPDLVQSPVNPQIWQEQGAEDLARPLADSLPDAIKTVQTDLGVGFAPPISIRVYASWDSFARYTGRQDRVMAVCSNDRISVSPGLKDQPQRIRTILTHEMVHALLSQHMGGRYLGLPAWFNEGLAVLVSDTGDGLAVSVSEDEAITALRQGKHFVPSDSESLLGKRYGSAFGISEGVFYRQAELFVRYLRDRDPDGFRRLLSALTRGEDFAAGFAGAYPVPLEQLWQDFRNSPSIRG